jgi:cyclophilin family peptidyl-prolyl cis-trans isomerase
MKRLGLFALFAGLAVLVPVVGQEKEAPVVVMDTSLGKIKIELYPKKAPITVKNFLRYVDEKHYDGTIFHRVVPGFVIQGGGLLPNGREKPTHEPIKNEAGNGLSNQRGTIAMARTDEPDSATAQFYINLKNNTFLDRAEEKAGYAVFGRVIEGMDVVDKIASVETGVGARESRPVEDVVIKSVRRIR